MVEFRGIPYLLFNKESLIRIATAIGKPLALAPETARKENLEVAKVLVKINLQNDLPTRIVSGFSDGREFDVEVSYPWLPPKCNDCHEFGHITSQCLRNVISTSPSRNRSVSRQSRPPRRARHSRSGRSRNPIVNVDISSKESMESVL